MEAANSPRSLAELLGDAPRRRPVLEEMLRRRVRGDMPKRDERRAPTPADVYGVRG